MKDESFKNTCVSTPRWEYLYHWVEVAETHILLDQAVMESPGVSVTGWISEWSVADADQKEPENRYRLYTRLGQKLVCAPDAAFLLPKDGFAKGYYLEEDRDTTQNSDRVAAQKCNGYAGMHEQRMHLTRHFPTANVERFSVLFVAPSVNRRDALKRSFGKVKGSWLYKFAAKPELKPETFLRAPVWHTCEGEPAPLLRGGE